MAVRKKGSASPSRSASTNGWDPGLVLAANQHAFQRWVQGLSALSEEMTHFIGDRLREDTNAWTKLVQCTDLNQALACQRQYADKMTTAYLDEANRLSSLAFQIANDAFRVPSERASEKAA